MIDPKITDLATNFSSYAAAVLKDHPRLTLDYSWPSVGVVDLFLSHLRRKSELSEGDRTLILSASGYLGSLAYECWRHFAADIDVKLELDEAGREISLTASGGKHLPGGGKFTVRITSALSQILTNPADPFPYFAQFSRPLGSAPPLVSLFTLGLCTGLTPYGEGPWKDLPENEAKEHLIAPELFLAKTTAELYSRSFPSEPRGAEAELYCAQLILPPSGCYEKIFGGRAAFGLAHALKTQALADDEITTIAMNLMQIPDQQIAVAAFLVAAATAKEPKPRLGYMGELLSPLIPLIKPALGLVRSELGKEDPLKLIESGKRDEAEKILDVERQLGLLPLIPDRSAELEPVPRLLASAYWCRPDLARIALDEYAASTPLSAALTLYGIFLDVQCGNIERARAELQDHEKNKVIARLESPLHRARRDELIAVVAAELGNFPVALPMFARAADSDALSPRERSILMTMHAELLYRTGNTADAANILSRSIALAPTLRAEVLRLEFGVGTDEDSNMRELERLVRHAPLSRPIFQLFFHAKLRRLVSEGTTNPELH